MAWLEKRGSKWYVAYRDATGNTKRIKGYTDRGATKQLMARWEKAEAHGAEGLIDPFAVHKAKPLAEHVKDWIAELRQLGRDDMYVAPCRARMERLADECEWKVLADISADSFCKWRETARSNADHNRKEKPAGDADKPMLSPQAMNHYLATLVTFCRWCVKRKRVAANPIIDVEKVDETGESRRERRALSAEELTRLLDVVPDHYRLAYQLLMATGLRRAELLALRWGDMKLNAPHPFIQLRAENTKGKRDDVVPLRADLAELLRNAKGDADDTDPVVKVLPRVPTHKTYLTAAKIPFEDDRGRRADLHSLRHSYGTLLSKGGVSPREAMSLMRHTDLRLTMKVYTDPRVFDLAGAVEKLPLQFGNRPDAEANAATGTNGKSGDDSAPQVAGQVAIATSGGHPESSVDNGSDKGTRSQVQEKTGVVRSRSSTVTSGQQGKKERAMGVEPTTASLEG
jgi:integrase